MSSKNRVPRPPDHEQLTVDADARLVLRRPRPEDFGIIRQMVRSPSMMRTQGGTLSARQSREFVGFVANHWDRHGFGHYLLWAGHRPVGLVSLKSLQKNYDLGLCLRPMLRGKGIATRAGRAVLDLAFRELRLRTVTARTLPGNRAGDRLLARLHFAPYKKTSLRYMGKLFPKVVVWRLSADAHVAHTRNRKTKPTALP